jgi:hypothetical protein
LQVLYTYLKKNILVVVASVGRHLDRLGDAPERVLPSLLSVQEQDALADLGEGHRGARRLAEQHAQLERLLARSQPLLPALPELRVVLPVRVHVHLGGRRRVLVVVDLHVAVREQQRRQLDLLVASRQLRESAGRHLGQHVAVEGGKVINLPPLPAQDVVLQVDDQGQVLHPAVVVAFQVLVEDLELGPGNLGRGKEPLRSDLHQTEENC